MSIYSFTMRSIEGDPVDFSSFKGKVLLVVNTASRCGFTPQLEALQSLYEQYQNQGFMVLGFPCNQFNQQEPGDSSTIKQFCESTYEITFPLFEKIEVNGPAEAPLYTYLKEQHSGFFNRDIKWNFTKFLVDREGQVRKRYAPTTAPKDIAPDIEALLLL